MLLYFIFAYAGGFRLAIQYIQVHSAIYSGMSVAATSIYSANLDMCKLNAILRQQLFCCWSFFLFPLAILLWNFVNHLDEYQFLVKFREYAYNRWIVSCVIIIVHVIRKQNEATARFIYLHQLVGQLWCKKMCSDRE